MGADTVTVADPRFVFDVETSPSSSKRFPRLDEDEANDLRPGLSDFEDDAEEHLAESEGSGDDLSHDEVDGEDALEGMDAAGFAGPSQKIVKPLTPEALAAFKAAQDKAGVVYISRIPPGMRPAKVRHLLGQHGEIGRVYLQQEDAKRAYLRRKHTSTKKAHFTEGWVEFKDKKVARAVAEMLNAQTIGGKKGTRWRDDIWTMKYLPKFKWNMLTEQIAHETAIHSARLRVELSQSRTEQREYLKNVELARVLDKRAERKRVAEEKAEKDGLPVPTKTPRPPPQEKKRVRDVAGQDHAVNKRPRKEVLVSAGDPTAGRDLSSVLGSIF